MTGLLYQHDRLSKLQQQEHHYCQHRTYKSSINNDNSIKSPCKISSITKYISNIKGINIRIISTKSSIRSNTSINISIRTNRKMYDNYDSINKPAAFSISIPRGTNKRRISSTINIRSTDIMTKMKK